MSFFLEFAESKQQKNKCPFLFSSDHGCSSSFCLFFFLKKILLCKHKLYFTYSKCPFSIQFGVFGFFLSFFLYFFLSFFISFFLSFYMKYVENKRVLNSSPILFGVSWFQNGMNHQNWMKTEKVVKFIYILRFNLLRLIDAPAFQRTSGPGDQRTSGPALQLSI